MTAALLLVAASAASVPVAAVEQPSTPATPPAQGLPDEVARALRVAGPTLPERITAVSGALLGRPYLADPLGEGVPPDADPLVRYDLFDCLTFVEEVLALSLADPLSGPAGVGAVRTAIRYGDREPSYVNRRHFMELQWIPANVAAGRLRDTTAEYGPTIHLEKVVTAATWAGWAGRKAFSHADDELPTGTMALDVLPLEAAEAAMAGIRSGSVLLTVREDRAGVPIWVSHVGFVIQVDGVPTMRHSTKLGAGESRDHALAWYLNHVRSYTPRKVLGVAILEPVSPDGG